MIKVYRPVFVFLLLLFATTTIMAEDSSPSRQLLEAGEAFTRELYQQLAKKDGNIFFSPISIHAILSMAFQGARGTTAEKFITTLKLADSNQAAEGYSAILPKLNSVENVTLLMANKLYHMEGKECLADFKNVLEKKFATSIEALNFGNSVDAAQTINKWVEEQTRNKIKDLIQSGDLDALTRLVMINAIYFKGDWLQKFSPERTKEDNFFITQNNPVKVQMMNAKHKMMYKHSEELQSQIVELPYLNKDVSMVLILPDEIEGIKSLEAKLATTPISSVLEKMHKLEVNLSMPKFKIEQTIDLKNIITELGLGEIFDETKANFSGIMTEPLFVSKILQKSFIEVNEEGSEAAAATGMVMMMRASLPRPPLTFRADHPFILFIIEKTEKHNVLFAGRISQVDN